MVTLSSVLLHPIATCLYGIMGSYFLNKMQMKKQAQEKIIKLLHDVQGPIDIGSGLTSLFPNVQLIYNDQKIDYKIQYITGTIKNTDEKRTVTTLNLPFELILPKNCDVLETKILESPKDEIKAINKGNIVEIPTPETFLHQEQIKYCILYKSPDKVESEIILKTRIADVEIIKSEVEAEKLNVENKSNYSLQIIFIFLILSLIFILLFSKLVSDGFNYIRDGNNIGVIYIVIGILLSISAGFIVANHFDTSERK